MKKSRVVLITTILLAMVIVLSGCSLNSPVEEYEVGLFLNKGTEIQRVLPPGRHTAWGFFDAIATVDVSAITVQWADPDLVTKDKQPVGLSIQVTFSRNREDVKTMWTEYHREATDDQALMNQVLGRIPRVAKAVTTQYTLDEMLGVDEEGNINEELGRYIVQEQMRGLLVKELDEIYCGLKDLGINNIAPDQGYLDLLKEKANAQVSVEVEQAKKLEYETRVLTEQAKTAVELEVAKRERLVAQERAKVYETNPGWLQLQIWEAAKEVFAGDNVWFIDPNTNLTLLFGTSGVVPYSP